ncbi:hypothetical protein [Serratia nevei]|uniref:hypothetical protein n=1 Tax=Serratia nevei TaxID=2703794 RepID=UPI003F808061
MNDLYSLISKYEEKRQQKKRKGDEFLPYIHTARALKEVGWLHREIVDFFYSSVEELRLIPEELRIDNNYLSKKFFIWGQEGKIDREKVKEEVRKLRLMTEKKPSDETSGITMFGNGGLLNFMKAIERTEGSLDENKKENLKSFYNENKSLGFAELIALWNSEVSI